jgi:outer membrane protein
MLWKTSFAGILLAASALAQTSSFPKPDYFRQVFKQNSTKVELRDPVRLRDFVIDGKLTLSLKDYLELVMANNTNIQVTFLSIEQPKNAITSAYGLWDPTASATFSASRSTTAATNPANSQNAGLGAVSKSLNQPLRLTFTQAMDSGTSYNVNFSGTKNSYSNSRNSYNPSLSSTISFQVTQSLLQNRGRYVNRIPVMQAESSYKTATINLRGGLTNYINAAETAYWNVISARENLKVQNQNLAASKSNLDFVQQQLDLGAIPELDIWNPKGNYAGVQYSVSQAQFALKTAEEALRLQIAADLDPEIRKLPIELTEPVDLPVGAVLPVDAEAEVAIALKTKPEILAATEKLGSDDLSIQSAQNKLLPDLQFSATYQSNGQGGTYTASGAQLLGGGSEVIPGGIADALSQMFGFKQPTYTGGLTLRFPIRSRSASMSLANSLITKKNDTLNLRLQQQNVRLAAMNAVTTLQGYVESLKLSLTRAEVQQKNYDAEFQKYQLGTSTNQNVVIALTSKLSADSDVVTAKVNLRKGILAVYNATGELMDQRNITVK